MKSSSRSLPRSSCLLIAAAGLSCLILAGGCARQSDEPAPDYGPIFFPAPPVPARVQYLGAISSPADLTRPKTTFADFILGAEPIRHALVKPISAIINGEKLYVCDTILNTVLIYDLATGEANRLPGDRANGKIKQPNNITIDENGRIYVADKERGALLIYDRDGMFVDAWGRPGEVLPVAVAVGDEALYVCDVLDHEIEIWDRNDGRLLSTFGGKGVHPGQFHFPTQIAFDPDGNLVVTDSFNFRVQVFTPEGELIRQIGEGGTGLGQFALPKGMAVDSRGRIYVADARFANVQIFDKDGKLLLFFGGPGPDLGNLDLPAGVSVHPWPALPWFEQRVADGFDPEFVVVVVNQKAGKFINFFAIARDTEGGEP